MSTYIELAQKRLKEFMSTHKVKPAEMDRLLALKKGTVRNVIRNKGISGSLYGELIVRELGADGHALQKLNKLRGIDTSEPEPVKQEPVAVKEEQSPADDSGEADTSSSIKPSHASKKEKESLAKRLREYKANHSLSWDDVAEELTASGIREFKGSIISVQIAPSTQLLKATLDDFNNALNYVEKHILHMDKDKSNASEGHVQEINISSSAKSETTDTRDDHQLSREDSQAEADVYAPTFTLPTTTCIGCGCTDHTACIGGCGWIAVDRITNKGVCSNCADHYDMWCEANRYLLHPQVIDNEILKAEAISMVSELFGLDIKQLKDLTPQIEMMVVCKRNNIGCRVVSDSVQVQ